MLLFISSDLHFKLNRFSLKVPLLDSVGFEWQSKTSTLTQKVIMEHLDRMHAFRKR